MANSTLDSRIETQKKRTELATLKASEQKSKAVVKAALA
jgi:hypothetical protein